MEGLTMAEYIERRAAIENLNIWCGGCGNAVECILAEPVADVAPVVHGQWGTGRFNLETGNYEEQCTRCRNFSKEYGKPCCPNCGAKMAGEE